MVVALLPSRYFKTISSPNILILSNLGFNNVKNSFATPWWTKIVSIALQTEGREILALTATSTAVSKSASWSMYRWQIPAPVSITGTVALFQHVESTLLPPEERQHLYNYWLW